MKRERFDEYIARFNAEDATAFDEFIAPDMRMINGALEFTGVQGMRKHYQEHIWPFFNEKLNILRFISNDSILAVQMWTRFLARSDATTIFGPVKAQETFDYRGLIMYDVVAGRFSSITVAYNSFIHTKRDGTTLNMGIPH